MSDGAWEVVVANNGDDDATRAVLARWATRMPLRFVTEPNPGKNRAMNRLLDLAAGELLIFTDDDVVAEPGWIAAHLRAARRWPDHGILAGVIRPLFPTAPPTWAADEPFRSVLFAGFEPDAPPGPIDTLPFGPNYAIRASFMIGQRFNEAIGPNGGEYAMGGETELLRRLAGAGTVYVPDAIVGHVIRAEQMTREFVRHRATRFGRGLVHLGDLEWSHRRVAGVPAYLWRGYLVALARFTAARMVRSRRTLAHDFRVHAAAGSIAESRRTGLPARPLSPGEAVAAQLRAWEAARPSPESIAPRRLDERAVAQCAATSPSGST